MASQINTFRTVTANVTTVETAVYTAPSGITSIILMAQVANLTANNGNVSFTHITQNNVRSELVKNYKIPKHDAANLLTGKLIVEQNSSVIISASANGMYNLTMSVLESTNA
jgi:hypothetical protein